MMTRARGTWAVAAMVLALASCREAAFPRQVQVGATSVDLSLLPDERYALIRAVDVLAFPRTTTDGVERSCDTLLAQALSDQVLRRLSAEHARVCPGREGTTLGKVEAGTRLVLVVASYVTSCNDQVQDELAAPGQVVAAGCEQIEAAQGKTAEVNVVLFPARDPAP